VIVDEAVRGHVPPAWFWALPKIVSSTVKDIVVGSDARFEDLGQHSLKGMPGEWRLFSLAD
jgi:hypothetical protein